MEWVIVGIAVLIAIGLFVVIPILTTWYSFSTVRLLWKNAKAERKLAERKLAERELAERELRADSRELIIAGAPVMQRPAGAAEEVHRLTEAEAEAKTRMDQAGAELVDARAAAARAARAA